MGTAISIPSSASSALDMFNASAKIPGFAAKGQGMTNAKAKATSQDFEAVFINSMFQQMYTGINGDGPFGGNGATGVWRSFLTDEYSKSFAKAGGIGIADQVYRSLMAHQEASS
jgi:Rod binding domain-containing protein